MNSVVVLSVPSLEFPQNTNSAFKVRLPRTIRFEEWSMESVFGVDFHARSRFGSEAIVRTSDQRHDAIQVSWD